MHRTKSSCWSVQDNCLISSTSRFLCENFISPPCGDILGECHDILLEGDAGFTWLSAFFLEAYSQFRISQGIYNPGRGWIWGVQTTHLWAFLRQNEVQDIPASTDRSHCSNWNICQPQLWPTALSQEQRNGCPFAPPFPAQNLRFWAHKSISWCPEWSMQGDWAVWKQSTQLSHPSSPVSIRNEGISFSKLWRLGFNAGLLEVEEILSNAVEIAIVLSPRLSAAHLHWGKV